MLRAVRTPFKKMLSFLLIFCVFAPSFSQVLAVPFWEEWTSDSEIESRAPEIVRTKLVSILVEEELLKEERLAVKIERYAMDAQRAIEGQAVLVPVPSDASAFDLWLGNAQLYFSGHNNDHRSQLVGTVLIGDVPVPVVDKGGRLHPTVWPLTDFDEPVYHWDAEAERFVWRSGGDEKAEIWHGVIRSDATTDDGRSKELREYFDRNHRFHLGEESFPKKVFMADLISQKIGITDDQRKTYENWIDHLDDFSYLRYNKNLAETLFKDLNPAKDIPLELLPEEAQNVSTDADFSALPDVLSKFIIDQMAKQYISSAKEKLVDMLKPAMYTGRWEAGDFDSTISFIAKKDEWAAALLREANDEVENIFREKLEDESLEIAIKGWLQAGVHFQPYYDHWVDSEEHHYYPVGEGIRRDRFHNGINVSDFDHWYWNMDDMAMKRGDPASIEYPAENCSLVRGTAPTEDHPAAQMVEFNRAYNFSTAELGDGECLYWANADDGEKANDPYEGCCAKNLQFSEEGFEMTVPDCTVNHGWVTDCEPVGPWECALEVPYVSSVPRVDPPFPGWSFWHVDRYEDYIGAILPVFDRNGARPVSSGAIGAQGCDEFLGKYEGWSSYADVEISTLMFHDEPRLETLQAQAKNQSVTAMPADDPRGASFYDHGENFRRINFPSSFDFIHFGGDILDDNSRRESLKLALEAELEGAVTSVTSTVGNAGKMSLSLFESTIWGNENRREELLDAILWLGTDLEDKHTEVLRGALSDSYDGARVLIDDDFDGYEVIEIIAEDADGGWKLSFEEGESESSNVFDKYERESSEFDLSIEEAIISGSEYSSGDGGKAIPEGWEEGSFSSNSDDGCSGINLLTWPVKCLLPWIASLPDSMGGTIPINPGEEGLPEETELILAGLVQTPQEVGEVIVSPEKILLSANDVMPITVSVEVKNKKGEEMSTPVSVSLSSSSNDIDRFMSVSPDKTRDAISGKTQFSLIPKTSDVGGKFSFVIEAGDVSKEIPVAVTRSELSMAVNGETEIEAGKVAEIEVAIDVTDTSGRIINDADGEWVELESDLGTFSADGRVQIDNGGAKLLFYPGTKAGKGKITVRDEKGEIPEDYVEIEIVPGAPEKLKFTGPQVLVKNSGKQDLGVIVMDKYGNEVTDDNDVVLDWSLPGGAELKGDVVKIEAGSGDDLEVGVEIEDIDGSEISRVLSVIDSPSLYVDVSEGVLRAGEDDVVTVNITSDPIVPGESEVMLFNDKGLGDVPEEVILVDGVGSFEIAPGVRSGIGLISLQSPGFVGNNFSFEVRAGEPKKVDISMENLVIKLSDEVTHSLSVQVLDKFGNIVPDFDGDISLLQNPGEMLEASDIDVLTDAGVFDKASPVKLYLENNFVDKDIETDDVVKFDPAVPRISRYKKDVKIEVGDKSGKVFLVATAPGLVADTLEFDVTDSVERDEFYDDLSPKSLLALLLGAAGGKFNGQNFGNRFLFSGETQAVATLSSDSSLDKLLYWFDDSGEMGGVEEVEFIPGNEFKFVIDESIKGVLKGVSGGITLGNSRGGGWSFIMNDDADYDADNKGNILRNGEEFIDSYSGGGMRFHQGATVIATDNWKEWRVEIDGVLIGVLKLNLDGSKVMLDENGQGLALKSLGVGVKLDYFLSGKNLSDGMGIGVFDLEESEDASKSLGSSVISAEDAALVGGVGWTSEWKPGTLFAAGNLAGEAVQYGASDAVVLLGDPTISVEGENDKSDLGLTGDMGKVIWMTSLGAVDQVLVGDLNSDGRSEIFPRVGEVLNVLYQSRYQVDNFRDTGVLLRFADGVKKVDIHNDSFGNLLHIVQLNKRGKLVFHKNNAGSLERTYIDLGLDAKIVDFDILNLNGDKFADLVLLDNENSLWFAYGDEEGWYSAQLVESFAARFEDVKEVYVFAEEQSGQDLRVNAFPQLESFYARFDGVENASWSGATTVIGDGNFVSVIDNSRFNVDYRASSAEDDSGESGDGEILIPGAEINHRVRISGHAESLRDFELIVPNGVGFVMDENSFSCDGCVGDIDVEVGKSGAIVGLGDISSLGNVSLKWKTIAGEVPPIRYMADDFAGADGRDDIAIAWQTEDGPAEAVQFLSTGSGMTPEKSSEATIDARRSPILRTHRRVQSELFPDLLPDDFDAESTAEDVMECMGEQRDSGGIPTMFLTPSVDEVQNMSLAPQKKTSWIDYIPSIAFLAPGPQSLYIPPFGIPLPLPWMMGVPVLWIAPTFPIFVGSMFPNPLSLFRLYVMPTTSLQVGIAICGGPVIDPSMSPKPIPFPPQCFVVIPQFGGSTSGSISSGGGSGGAGGDGVAGGSCFALDPAGEASAQQEFMMQLFAQAGDGRSTVDFNMGAPFMIMPQMKPSNRQIKAADVLSMWVQAQWRELTNFKFPRFSLKLPKFPKSSPAKKGEGALAKLKKSPFIDVKVKKIAISYPEISTEKLKQLDKDIKGWKKRSKDKLEETTTQWKTASCENLEGGDWDKNKKACISDPDAASAFDVLSELAKLKAEGINLQKKALLIMAKSRMLKTENGALEEKHDAELEAAQAFESDSAKDYEAKIEQEQAAIVKIMDDYDESDDEEMLSDGDEILADITLNLDALILLREPTGNLKLTEAKAIVSEKLESTISDTKKSQNDIEVDLDVIRNLGPKMYEDKINGKIALIELYQKKMFALESMSEEEKDSMRERLAEDNKSRKELRAEKKKAREEARAAKKEEMKASSDEKKKEMMAKQKQARGKMKKELKKVFEDIAVDPIEKKWREFDVAVDKNVKALKSYPNEVKKLKELPKKLDKLLDEIVGMADVVNEYWAEWITKNERAVKKWEKFGADAKKAISAWGDIPATLKKFGQATASSNGGSMTRGTLLSWLKNMMLSAIKFPVIPMPQIPDVEIDLSGVKIGMTVDVPKLEFTPVKVAPGELPGMPDLNLDKQFSGAFAQILQAAWNKGDISAVLKGELNELLRRVELGELSIEELRAILDGLPAVPEVDFGSLEALFGPLTGVVKVAEGIIPVIPVLPEAPKLPATSMELPPLLLPTLPSLIEPPKFPDFLKIPNLIMIVPKVLMGLLGMLSRGLMPVPEWHVATSVVNATNRTLLLPIDFMGSLPPLPKLVLPPIKYKLSWQFANALPSLTMALEAIALTFNAVTTQISNAAKGVSLASTELKVPLVNSEFVVADTGEIEVYSLLPESVLQDEDRGALIANYDDNVIGYYGGESGLSNFDSSIVPGEMRNWQASTSNRIIQTSDFPESLPSGFDIDSIPTADSSPVVEPRILWFDAASNTVEPIMDFPLKGARYTHVFADLDRDGYKEIVYAVGGQIFMKRLVDPTFSELEKDMAFETPDNIIEWDFVKFSSGIIPATSYEGDVKPEGVKLEFLPPDMNDASYFEWIISNRPDRIFEDDTDSEDRASESWKRVGFLVRPPASKYEIRKAGAQIKSVSGSPVMYGMPLRNLKPIKGGCGSSDVVLPFFPEETIFVGVEDRSRMTIRTLAREGQREEVREIELRHGEETVVDFAEVCLSRGEVDYLEVGDTEKIEPNKGDYFLSGMRLELGKGDRVELGLYDDTEVVVSGGEKYELHQFSSREEMINSFKKLEDGNWYGQFKAFKGDEESWTRSKDLIHDPQPADDKTPPRIKLRRGIKRKVAIGAKIEIDATLTVEKKGYSRVWWESDDRVLIDSSASKYSPVELLKILLPAKDKSMNFEVILHVIDLSGNEAIQKIKFEVVAPDLELIEVSERDASIKGKVLGRLEGLEVRFIRERDGREEIISPRAISGKDGMFEVKDLSRSGGLWLNNKDTGEASAEILPNGRPVLLGDDLVVEVYSASDYSPLEVELTSPNGSSAATISFMSTETELEIPYGVGRGNMPSDGVWLVDSNDDMVEWRSAGVNMAELWDKDTGVVLGEVDGFGQFKSLADGTSLRLTQVGDERDRVSFDVLRGNKKVAEIVFPDPELLLVR